MMVPDFQIVMSQANNRKSRSGNFFSHFVKTSPLAPPVKVISGCQYGNDSHKDRQHFAVNQSKREY